MKKTLTAAFAALLLVSVSSIASAAPPVCSGSDAKGTVCWSSSAPVKLMTSCGSNQYVNGSGYTGAKLDELCGADALYSASGAPLKGVAANAPSEKTKAR